MQSLSRMQDDITVLLMNMEKIVKIQAKNGGKISLK